MKIRAKYLWRGDGTILENGILETRGRRIVSLGRVGQKPPGRSTRDLGESIILPGFVNGHAHLELTALRGRVRSGRDFSRWLERVRGLRAGMTARDLKVSSRMGVEESIRSGTTTIVDHCYTGSSLKPLGKAGIRAHLVFEMIALHPRRIPILERTFRRMVRSGRGYGRIRVGVAPHAPYTASPALYRAARKWIGKGQLLSTHLAEHPAEGEFLRTGGGQLRRLLLKRNLEVDALTPSGLSPFGHLESLGVLRPGTLLVHCNYIDAGDMRILKRKRMPVIYCPRSHAFFRHPTHPVGRLRRAGVLVGLGTDSLTSNRTLSILDEMKFLHGCRADLSPMDLFWMATRDGARAVWGDSRTGLLARGRTADVIALRLSGGRSGRVLERALREESKVTLTVIEGIRRFEAGEE